MSGAERTAKPAKKTPYQKRDVAADFRARYPGTSREDAEKRLAPFRAFISKPLGVQDRSKAAAEVSPSPPALPTAIPAPITAVAASATAPVATSADYSVQSFCVDFNLSSAIVAKIEAMGSDVFPLGKPFLHEMDESDWNDCGFTEAERITLLRKHQHLLDSKTLGTSPLPLPPHFYPMLAGTTISDFAKAVGLSDVFSARLEKMGFSLDDPEGMANLSDNAWKVAGFQKKWEISFVRKEYASYLKEMVQL
jgi:hypothetical protein